MGPLPTLVHYENVCRCDLRRRHDHWVGLTLSTDGEASRRFLVGGSAFVSDDGGAFSAIAADSVENLTVLGLARKMLGWGHPALLLA
jgi:hypothetical protein